MAVADSWIRDSLNVLARFQFTSSGANRVAAAPIELVPWEAVQETRGPRIVVPVDLPTPLSPRAVWSVPFDSSAIRLWNPVPSPGAQWNATPGPDQAVWWRHPTGTLVPAWNLWGNLRDLLSFREEQEILTRDSHGRFPAEASPRFHLGLLDAPAVNDTNALLLDAALSLGADRLPAFRLGPDILSAPGVLLSHDCDQLRGNDLLTQSIRAYRALRELARVNVSQAGRHLHAIGRNAISPRRFFADNLAGMIELERQFGFASVCYFLTGRGGRLGARSGNAIALEVASRLPPGWEAGVHYNYWTVGAGEVLRREIQAISSAVDAPVVAGRAHYLRFDPTRHPEFLERNGIQFDESIGWAMHLGYRAGIAGPFFPFAESLDRRVAVLEMPMMCMDAALVSGGSLEAFDRLYDHLRAVGGVLSVLVHPGAFDNPEFPECAGLYEAILARVYAAGGRSWTPSQMLAHAASSGAQPVSSS